VVRKSPFPIDLRYRCYNSVRTNVLHYDDSGPDVKKWLPSRRADGFYQ